MTNMHFLMHRPSYYLVTCVQMFNYICICHYNYYYPINTLFIFTSFDSCATERLVYNVLISLNAG